MIIQVEWAPPNELVDIADYDSFEQRYAVLPEQKCQTWLKHMVTLFSKARHTVIDPLARMHTIVIACLMWSKHQQLHAKLIQCPSMLYCLWLWKPLQGMFLGASRISWNVQM